MSERSEPADLVEPEGVNAGSEAPEDERHRAVRGGGDAGRAPASVEDADRREADDPAMAGAPGTDPQDPSQAAGPPGQDSGSGR